MPTTWCGRSFIWNTLPTTVGSPPKLRCQYLWLRNSTAGAPGASSASDELRPYIGWIPSTSKKFAETTPVDDAFRLGTTEQDEPHVVELDDAVEALRRPVIQDFFVGEAHVLDAGQRLLLAQHDELLAVRERQRPSSTPLTTLKMAVLAPMPSAMVTITTKAKPRIARSVAQAVADVLHQRLAESRQPGVAHVVFHPVDCAEVLERARARASLGRHAAADVVLGRACRRGTPARDRARARSVRGGTARRGGLRFDSAWRPPCEARSAGQNAGDGSEQALPVRGLFRQLLPARAW